MQYRSVRRRASLTFLIVGFVASIAVAQDVSGQQPDQREPITFAHVYGNKRISVGRSQVPRLRWASDSQFIQRKQSGWVLVDAPTGDEESLYERELLQQALTQVEGIDSDKAAQLASGDWRDLDVASRTAVFESGTMLIRAKLDGSAVAVVRGLPESRELLTVGPDSATAAFISRNELWVANFETGTVQQLTHDASDTVRNGKADWVYFEEVYNRNWSGFRYSPDGRHIAYQQFDDTLVPTFTVIDSSEVDQKIEIEHWPQAGDTNPTVRLGVVSVDGGDTVWVDSSRYPSEDLLITHFNWLPDSSQLYWYAQNRIQTWLDINRADPATGLSMTLLRDSNGAWLESPGDLKFLQDGSFLFRSDRNGWMHVYRVSPDGTVITPITSGEWEVRTLHAVDKNEKSVLLSGTLDSHIAENLYRVPLDGSCTTERLTPEAGHHISSVSPEAGLFIDRFSTVHQPESTVLRDGSGAEIRVLGTPGDTAADRYRFGTVELKQLPMADGAETTGIVVYPPEFDETKKHPVWLMTYGGPHRPNVRNAWRSRLQEHLLANLGIVVIRFDPRSGSGYGSQSAWLAYRKLGVEEARDVEALCDWLAEQPWADAERIGMSGHSYGGYYTAYAMTHTDKLCAGIAGAPVTDWSHYDTIYTERFMSTPQDNPEGYRVSSVVNAADQLQGRLLILHGMKDDNVHPSNTMQFVHALQKANRDFTLMVYPTARHGIFGTHYSRLMYNFIVESMGRGDAAVPAP
jgi:dipeptidyl-peptidase-4